MIKINWLRVTLLVMCLGGPLLAQPPRLFLPESVTVKAGENLTLPVRLTNGAGIRGLQFELLFDPAQIRFMGSLPGGLLDQHGFSAVETQPGRLTILVWNWGDTDLRSGPGTVGELILHSLRMGDTTLELDGVVASDRSARPVALVTSSGRLVSESNRPRPSLIFPHYVNGESGGRRNSSRILLRNLGDWNDTGQIIFRRANGEVASTADYAVEPRGVSEIQTSGAGALQSGPIEVYSDLGPDSQLGGTQVFTLLGRYVSVPAVAPGPIHQLYVSIDSNERTGVALFNPDFDRPLRVRASLLGADGQLALGLDFDLAPGEQSARFIDELILERIPDFPLPFRGTINLFGQDGRELSAIGLIQNRASGALIAVAGDVRAFDLR